VAQRLTNIHFEAPRPQVAATLGCPSHRKPSTRVVRQIDDAVSAVAERAETRVEYRNYPVQVERGRVEVAGRVTFNSGKLALALDACRSVYVYVVTLGREVDRLIEETMDRRPDVGVVIDAAASVAAEAMVDRLEQTLSEQLAPWAALSLPFSPGHCDWPVTDQAKIFSLLPERPAGVVLSSDLMMIPRKSISGVLGVGPVEAVTESRNPCAACQREDCPHRRCSYRR
jgi:hypothetical protein